MIPVITWYLLFAAVGLISFPMTFRVFSGLPGRGYAFSRTLGLFLWAYIFWLLGSFGILQNDTGGVLFSLLLVVCLSVFAFYRTNREDYRRWWQSHYRMVLVVEVLFALAFAAWAVIRAMNPDITATEKPMELAFVNAILQSPSFPPADPWLSGYAISYYYFGYVIVAMVARMTGTAAGVAFNLAIAGVFALGAVGAYGVVHALLARGKLRSRLSDSFLGLFGPLFVLVIGNLEGFLDVLHARGLFWRVQSDGSLSSGFWKWLDLKDLVNPPAMPFSWQPARFLWWWRASRVINDTSFTGGQQEVIDEFPFFSFLLSDLHPHVLAIPFVLLAIALALNLLFREGKEQLVFRGRTLDIAPNELLMGGLVFGGLAFLNTWDFPIYVALFTGAYLLRRVADGGWSWDRVAESIGIGAVTGVLGVLLYLPFYTGFSSQAGGILPNVLNPTRGVQLWVMFGSLFLPVLLYFLFISRGEKPAWGRGLAWGFGVVLALYLISLLAVLAVSLNPSLAEEALRSFGAPDAAALLNEAFRRRLTGFGGWLTLALLLSFTVSLLFRRRNSRSTIFVLLMVFTATMLVIGPEFLYLRDLFGTRMNTVFKFYYQAWILLGLSAGYGAARVVRDWRTPAGTVAAMLVGMVLVMGLVYPVFSLYTKTSGFNPPAGLNLDGTLHGAYLNPDDRAAVAWLLEMPRGTVLEAVGGSYSGAARIATHTGYPNVLGWVFHEGQWRGGYEEVGSRESDVARIYETGSWDETAGLLNKYGVRYIYLGNLERSTYNVNEAKFRRNLPVLFEQGSVVIYGVGFEGPSP